MLKNFLHILAISMMVYFVIFIGSLLPVNLNALNPFKKSIGDYESSDLVFSRFKADINFDDRIFVINVGKPNRKEIAAAIAKLDSLQVKAIGVDVVFEKFNNTSEDSLLLDVINSSSVLVLADEYETKDQNSLPHVCHELFCNESNLGFTNFVAKANQSIRYFLPKTMHSGELILAFASKVLKVADKNAYHDLMNRNNDVEQINYRGSADSYVQMEIADFLASDFSSSDYNQKIALLGYMGDDKWAQSTRDKYFTPINDKVALKTVPDMFGVVIHANVISMLMDRDYINETSSLFNRWSCFILIFIFVAIFRKIFESVNPGYWKIVRLVQLLFFFLLFIFSTLMFHFFNLKIGFTVALVGVALSWDMVKIYENVILRKQKFFKPKS